MADRSADPGVRRCAAKDGGSCDIHSVLGANGLPVAGKDLPLTTLADGDWAVNTIQPLHPPFLAGTPDCRRLPALADETIGDRLTDAGLDWAWYSGGWNDAVAGHPDPLFQYHHQPFAYLRGLRARNRRPLAPAATKSEFVAAAQSGETLPAVSFVKPIGAENEHPGYTDLASG